jgi:hypothetical protein
VTLNDPANSSIAITTGNATLARRTFFFVMICSSRMFFLR